MPTCRCGKRIQSGRLCQDCERDERLGGFSPASTQSNPDEQRYECSNCGHTYTDDGWNGCPKCDSLRRRYVGDVDAGDDDDDTPGAGAAVALPDGGEVADRDVVENLVDQIRGTWDDDDPLVMAFEDGESNPVVADVDGELRVLSSSIVFPREVDHEDVREALDRHGRPSVDHLSEHSDRFDRGTFEDSQEIATDGGEPRPLDTRLREEIDHVLVVGASKNTDRRMHIPQDDGDTPLCDLAQGRSTNYQHKPVGVFPPGYIPWCDTCALSHLGSPEDINPPTLDIAEGEIPDGFALGVTQTGESTHIVDYDSDSVLTDRPDVGDDRSLCGHIADFEHVDVDGVTDPLCTDCCTTAQSRHGVDPRGKHDQPLRADGDGREAFLRGESHWCDICDRPFESTDELANHDCQPVRTDGGPELGSPASRVREARKQLRLARDGIDDEHATEFLREALARAESASICLEGALAIADQEDPLDELAVADDGAVVGPPLPVVKRGSIGVTVQGPGPEQYERWEQARSDGGDRDA